MAKRRQIGLTPKQPQHWFLRLRRNVALRDPQSMLSRRVNHCLMQTFPHDVSAAMESWVPGEFRTLRLLCETHGRAEARTRQRIGACTFLHPPIDLIPAGPLAINTAYAEPGRYHLVLIIWHDRLLGNDFSLPGDKRQHSEKLATAWYFSFYTVTFVSSIDWISSLTLLSC